MFPWQRSLPVSTVHHSAATLPLPSALRCILPARCSCAQLGAWAAAAADKERQRPPHALHFPESIVLDAYEQLPLLLWCVMGARSS